MSWTNRAQFSAGAGKGIFLCHYVLTRSGDHPGFYPMGIKGAFSGGKTARMQS